MTPAETVKSLRSLARTLRAMDMPNYAKTASGAAKMISDATPKNPERPDLYCRREGVCLCAPEMINSLRPHGCRYYK
jgi:hypothetical protein